MPTRAVVWFRNDLRLEENPAFADATRSFDEVATVVVVDPGLLASVGSFRRNAWLANVAALDRDLRSLGGALSVTVGDPADLVPALCTDADAIIFNEATSRWGRRRDERVLEAAGRPARQHWGTLVTEPGAVLTRAGTLSRVFTAFEKTWSRQPLELAPDPGPAVLIQGQRAELPAFDAPVGPVGTTGAHELLDRWSSDVDDYDSTRDVPSSEGTSKLSTALRFGTISPRTVVDILGIGTPGRAAFVRQLAWRDWYAHLMIENPDMGTNPLRSAYDRIAWSDDPDGLDAWRSGRTGYPIVDAGMRQLAETGWMHNRVRMIAASFLVKDLLIDWREGERWFRHLLVDADPSQNAGNWQWVAGTGPDAAPYFRIFNPVTQSRRYDPTGAYIRTWVPELARLDDAAIHAPWEVAPLDLASADVVIGSDYPPPIVDHSHARDRTLAAYRAALEDA